jgi:hypothetical protein
LWRSRFESCPIRWILILRKLTSRAIEMRTIIPGETRKTALVVTVEFPVSVRVEWPEGIPFSNEDAIDAAMGMVSRKRGRNVGPIGKIVWAWMYGEVQDEDAEVTEVIVPKF